MTELYRPARKNESNDGNGTNSRIPGRSPRDLCDNIRNSEVVMKVVLSLCFVILLAGCAPAPTLT
ncbi:MAG: hypothetical protein B6D40_05515, partial [Anaerolineae bacterium UTCFX3]